MHILSFNVNGIKRLSVDQLLIDQLSIKSFFTPAEKPQETTTLHSLLKTQQADVVFLQELKTTQSEATKCLSRFSTMYKYQYVHASTKKGYSGVAILSKTEPKGVWRDLELLEDNECVKLFHEHELHTEGRILCAQFGDCMLVNVYAVNSGKDLKRLHVRRHYEACVEHLIDHIQNYMGLKVLVAGDMNVCPTLSKLDCMAPSFFCKISGGIADEMFMLESLCTKQGLVDVYRKLYPDGKKYSNSVGKLRWRLDLFLLSESLLPSVSVCDILEEVTLSDHSPILIKWQ